MGRKPRDSVVKPVSAAVGRTLRRIREGLGLTQRVASMRAGISGHRSIRLHEEGLNTITVDYLVRYCRVYEVDPAEVLSVALDDLGELPDAGSDDPSE